MEFKSITHLRKEHTCCIFMWFAFQFGSYLKRWRVSYLSSKLMGNILSIIRIFITFFKIAPVPHS